MKSWVEIRDALLDAVKFEDVTEEMKSNFTKWLLNEMLPVVENAAADFTSKIKEQAVKEDGWCKIRDGVVLPLIIDGGLWLVETVLKRTVEKTA